MTDTGLLEVIYASAATVPFSKQQLAQLLIKARANNERLGVSGLLLFVEGSFLQVLEGPAATVDALYEKISRDERHAETLVLKRSPIEERSFADWRMGFVGLSAKALREVPGFVNFLRDGRLHLEEGVDASKLRSLLTAFRDGRYRRQVEAA